MRDQTKTVRASSGPQISEPQKKALNDRKILSNLLIIMGYGLVSNIAIWLALYWSMNYPMPFLIGIFIFILMFIVIWKRHVLISFLRISAIALLKPIEQDGKLMSEPNHRSAGNQKHTVKSRKQKEKQNPKVEQHKPKKKNGDKSSHKQVTSQFDGQLKSASAEERKTLSEDISSLESKLNVPVPKIPESEDRSAVEQDMLES